MGVVLALWVIGSISMAFSKDYVEEYHWSKKQHLFYDIAFLPGTIIKAILGFLWGITIALIWDYLSDKED